MSDIDKQIFELIEKLKESQSQADLLSNLEDWKEATDFDWYLFALNRTKSMQESEHVVITNYPSEWMEKYESEKLFQKDPVVKYVMNHQNNIFWDSFKDLDGYNSPEQLEVLELASGFGIVSGCSIPCNSYGNFAVFSMANKSEEKLSKLNEYLPFNHFYGNQFLESVLRISNASDDESMYQNLTEREMECVFWGSEGKTAWEIAKILDISERTVVFHFANVTKKMNATTRQHAISKALLFGLVKPSV